MPNTLENLRDENGMAVNENPQVRDARQYAPATLRNREPILQILSDILPATGTVLEVSSGTGEHAAFFAPQLQPLQWIPSDPNPIARSSIAAWRSHSQAQSLYPPLALDACAAVWPVEREEFPADWRDIVAIVNINMIHIAPWKACLGLMAGAARILPPEGLLYLYGPFKREGKHTAASNAAFDASLRSQDPEWGVRDLEDVVRAAGDRGLQLARTEAMPANNLSVVFKRS